MHALTIDDTRLAVSDDGEGEPLVLLHTGFIADAMAPLALHPALGGHRRVTYHRRGYGLSEPAAGPIPISRQADDALAVMRALGIERAHLLGHSIGANVAIEVALTAPEAVASLTVLEPLLLFAVTPSSGQFVADTAAAAYARLEGGDGPGALDAWLSGAFGAGWRDAVERRLPGAIDRAVQDLRTPFRIEVPALQEWARGPDDVRGLRVPVLSVLGGASEWPGFRETHESLLSWAPGAKGLVVEEATHLLQITHPTPVAQGVAGFLAEHPLEARAVA